MAGLGVVVNPRSRRNRGRADPAEAVKRLVGDHGIVREAGDRESLHAAAIALRDAGIDLLAVHGGDGTNGVVLTALREVWGGRPLPRLAPLRGGTMNTVANGLGVPRGRPEALLRDLVSALDDGRPLETRPTGTLDVAGRLGFLFGTGVIHGFLAEYYGRGRPYPTPLTAVETLAAAAGSALVQGRVIRRMAERCRAALVVDGERIDVRDWLFVGAGTAPQLGLGFEPFHLAKGDPTSFHLLAATAPPSRFVWNLPRLYRGRGIREGDGFERLAREVVLEVEGAEARYMVDGDLDRSPSPLRVGMGPVLEVVVGTGGPPRSAVG